MRRSLCTLVLFGALGASCGGGDGSMSSASTSAPVTPTGTPTTPVAQPPQPTAGPPTTPTATPGSLVITISALRFSPLNLAVPPGATITVQNLDGMPHSVTSESAPGVYTPGAVNGVSFDTGEFSTGTRSFVIPASAMIGSVVPYYCRAHTSAMATPTGTITIIAGAPPTTAPPVTPTPTGTTSQPNMPPTPTPVMPPVPPPPPPMPMGPY